MDGNKRIDAIFTARPLQWLCWLLLCFYQSSFVLAGPIIGDSADNPIMPNTIDPVSGIMSFEFTVGVDGLG